MATVLAFAGLTGMVKTAIAYYLGMFLVVMIFDNWQDILRSVKKIFNLKDDVTIVHSAVQILASISGNFMHLKVESYVLKSDGKWITDSAILKIDVSQVPEWAKIGLCEKETDVTKRYEQVALELEM